MAEDGNPIRTVKFLTFNTWGLKYVSKHRRTRLRAIAHKLVGQSNAVRLEASDPLYDNRDEDYDVIALQEIWCVEDWEYLVEICSSKYPYHRAFSSGILTGPGLAILSKIPIESTFLYRFPINGRPSAVFRGDWYVGKSVAITELRPISPDTPPLVIMNTHMHAPYARTGDAAYTCHRSCQAWDFVKLANLYKKAGYAVVLVGDMNSRPGSLPHNLLTVETGLIDSWEQLKGGKQDLKEIEAMSPIDQIIYGCTTCDSTLNTWRATRKSDEACRLDYALIDSSKLRTVDAVAAFTETIPNIGSFSDHFAYSCTLEVLPRDRSEGDQVAGPEGILLPTRGSRIEASERQGAQEFLEARKALLLHRIAIYDDLLSCISEYLPTANKQRLFRGLHFWFGVAMVIGSAVVTTFTANRAAWSSIFWVVFGSIMAATGTIDGLISFLFGRKEIRALNEVYKEVQDSRHNLKLDLERENT